MPNQTKLGDQQVQIDRRWKTRRQADDSRAKSCSAEAGGEADICGGNGSGTDDEQKYRAPRRKKQRRRQIDPTTCERDYNAEEIAFMQALDDYKRSSGRMFPTCSEILEVVRGLGYTQLTEEERQLLDSINQVVPEADDSLEIVDDGEEELEMEELLAEEAV